MSEQKELSVMLGEIEKQAEKSRRAHGEHDICLCQSCTVSRDVVPRLVKALRRALPAIECHGFLKRDITAILNGEEEKKKNLGEPRAV